MLQQIKEFFSKKTIGYFLTIPAVICILIANVLYKKNGITQFQPNLDTSAIVCCWLAFGVGICSFVVDLKYLRFASYLISLYALMRFVFSQVTYIANILVSIDGTRFSKGFITTLVFFILGIVFFILSGCLSETRPWKKEA